MYLMMVFDDDYSAKMCVVFERRGWPETANTWEPYANLVSCFDVIEAFEEGYCFFWLC